MLFHVTATHTVDDCPGYNPGMFPELVPALENMRNVAKEHGVTIHWVVNAAPEHVTYMLVEADSPASLAFVTTTVPLKQDFKVTAVVREEDMVAMAKEMMSRG